ncbi:MAG: DUF3472 domain-containing protein [Planctomycetota bacterium]|jgi:hypothetical protein
MNTRPCLLATIFTFFLLPGPNARAAEWSVPVAGNAFQTAPQPGDGSFHSNGTIKWSDSKVVFSVYFHVDQSANLQLKINTSRIKERSTLRARIGDESFDVAINDPEQRVYDVGPINVPAGYVRADLQGVNRTGDLFAEIHSLIVVSDTEDLKLDYVKSNKGNMFYWGRRGPSVHLRYEVPKDRPVQYAYSEINVPVGDDPIGSFYMANGFGEGYLGIQVNGPDERRVLFSVWSPFKTNKPSDIPQDQRVEVLGRGRDVHIGRFGGEGSGGQSFLVYPWKAGKTYRFLTEVKPDGEGNTIYASWFGDKSANEWRFIARFRRPKTDTHLHGFHSFLESFSPNHGHIGRQARYGNVWVCDVTGEWHECTRARFSVDATGDGRHRLDFMGGGDGEYFFLRNCGFFSETGQPGDVFTRKSTAHERPNLDFSALPRK